MEEEKSRSTQIVEEAIRAYPKLKAAYHGLKSTSSTVQYEVVRNAQGGRSDPTASAALRELPPEDQRRYNAVQAALRRTQRRPHCTERLLIIKLAYWQGCLPLTEIAIKLNLSTQLVRRYRKDFIRAVNELLAVSDCEGCIHFRYLTTKIKACHYCADTGQLRLLSKEKPATPCPHFKAGSDLNGSYPFNPCLRP